MIEEEIWREHPTLGIMVSNLGRVETCRGKHVTFGCDNGYGYKIVGWKGKFYRIHRLVYETFVGEIPDGYDINHIDEDKTNNRVDNLNVMTRKENINWGSRNQRASESMKEVMKGKLINRKDLSKEVNQYTKDGRFVKTWKSTMDAERIGGFYSGNISSCCLGKLKSAGGYIWRYK